MVKNGVKEQRRSPNTVSPRINLWEKTAQKMQQTRIHSAIYFLLHWPMDSHLLTVWTLSSNRTLYLAGLVPSTGSYTIPLFFSSVNAGDMVRTPNQTHRFQACVRLLNTIGPIFTPSTNPVDWVFTNLQDGKSSWRVLCDLTCNITKGKYIHLRFRPVLTPVCVHKVHHRWQGHIHTHCSFLPFSQECKSKCLLNIFNQE